MDSGLGQEEEIQSRVLALRDADRFGISGSHDEEVKKCRNKRDQYENRKATEDQRTRYYEEEETDTWAFAWMPAIEDFVRTSSEIANGPLTGQQYGTTQNLGPPNTVINYNVMLSSDKGFRNPSAVEAMGRFYHVSQSLSFLVDVSDDGYGEGDWFYEDLRNEQDKIWADESVKKGVALARAGKHVAAVECYDAALKVCHRHMDALTARGAALANIGKLQAAVVAFEMALEVNPRDKNAIKYLEATKKLRLKAKTEWIATPSVPPVHPGCSIGDHFGGGNAAVSSSSSMSGGTKNMLSNVVMPLNKERLVLTGAGGRIVAKEEKKYGFVGLDGEEVMEGDEDDAASSDGLSFKEEGESSSGKRHHRKKRKREKKAKKKAKKAAKKPKKRKRHVEISEKGSSSSSN